jgi:fumarate reductase subunit D
VNELSLGLSCTILGITALLNAWHPMVTSPVTLLFGAMLGNETSERRAAAGTYAYLGIVLGSWIILGLALAALLSGDGFGAQVLSLVFGMLTALVALVEISSFLWPKHHSMHASHEDWRLWRKQAYRIKSVRQAGWFATRAAPWVFLYAGAPFVAALNATRGDWKAVHALGIVGYGVVMFIPLFTVTTSLAHGLPLGKLQHHLSRSQRSLHLLQGLLLLALTMLWLTRYNWGPS